MHGKGKEWEEMNGAMDFSREGGRRVWSGRVLRNGEQRELVVRDTAKGEKRGERMGKERRDKHGTSKWEERREIFFTSSKERKE